MQKSALQIRQRPTAAWSACFSSSFSAFLHHTCLSLILVVACSYVHILPTAAVHQPRPLAPAIAHAFHLARRQTVLQKHHAVVRSLRSPLSASLFSVCPSLCLCVMCVHCVLCVFRLGREQPRLDLAHIHRYCTRRRTRCRLDRCAFVCFVFLFVCAHLRVCV